MEHEDITFEQADFLLTQVLECKCWVLQKWNIQGIQPLSGVTGYCFCYANSLKIDYVLGSITYPVALEVKCHHCRPEGSSRVHAGSCIRDLEDT